MANSQEPRWIGAVYVIAGCIFALGGLSLYIAFPVGMLHLGAANLIGLGVGISLVAGGIVLAMRGIRKLSSTEQF
jgi:hypothetical protein